MFCLNDTMRYFLCPGKTDMRKGINSLCGLVHDKMGYDVRLGDVFIFVNRNKTTMKRIVHTFRCVGVLFWNMLQKELPQILPLHTVAFGLFICWQTLVFRYIFPYRGTIGKKPSFSAALLSMAGRWHTCILISCR